MDKQERSKYYKDRYEKRKAGGVCTYCGTRPPALHRNGCEECMTARRKGGRHYYQRDRGDYPRERYRQDTDGYREWRLQRTYGISLDDYRRLEREQGGVCAICGRTEGGGRGGRLHIDHDHSTNTVRGLLCFACNRGIGCFQDKAQWLRSAAKYITSGPPGWIKKEKKT